MRHGFSLWLSPTWSSAHLQKGQNGNEPSEPCTVSFFVSDFCVSTFLRLM